MNGEKRSMKEKKKLPRCVKIIIGIFSGFVGAVILIVGIYVIYLQANYYRIEDYARMEIDRPVDQELKKGGQYSVATYNIGFGAYQSDYTFFMDEGKMKDGTPTAGKHSRALSKEAAIANVSGSIGWMKELQADIMLFQEVDVDSTRSYRIDQKKMIEDAFETASAVYSSNFHSGYLAYPLYEMHGKVEAGTLTLSTYRIAEAIRRQLPVSTSFISKFFDLDRCFTINRMPVDDRELVVINLHLSAYDEGGVFRAKQVALLNSVLAEEYEKGNYVIAGGDFNHDIADSSEYFPSRQQIPEWLAFLNEEDLTEGFSFADAENNAPTCRGADIPYEKDVTYTCVVDGFIVSDNISVKKIYNVDHQFLYSDHNPVYMEFTFCQ